MGTFGHLVRPPEAMLDLYQGHLQVLLNDLQLHWEISSRGVSVSFALRCYCTHIRLSLVRLPEFGHGRLVCVTQNSLCQLSKGHLTYFLIEGVDGCLQVLKHGEVVLLPMVKQV